MVYSAAACIWTLAYSAAYQHGTIVPGQQAIWGALSTNALNGAVW
jgi:hypothetical protein